MAYDRSVFVRIVGALVGLGTFLFITGQGGDWYRSIHVSISGDANRAFQYADNYFGEGSEYSIEKAEAFYVKALILDPDRSSTRHQLARIAFLHGDFDKALVLINEEIVKAGDSVSDSTYYIRALILAYKGDYVGASNDYEYYIAQYPANWAAANDYAWVLLQQKRFEDAIVVTSRGLAHHPTNPWLLNTNAIALYEMGLVDAARDQIQKAAITAQYVREQDWLNAYPGNDPLIAADGVYAFQESVVHNMHTIAIAAQSMPYNDQ